MHPSVRSLVSGHRMVSMWHHFEPHASDPNGQNVQCSVKNVIEWTKCMTRRTTIASAPMRALATHSVTWLAVSKTRRSTTWSPITFSKLHEWVFNDLTCLVGHNLTCLVRHDLTRLESGPLCAASRATMLSTSLRPDASSACQVAQHQQRPVT
jgi:hypothetical protein